MMILYVALHFLQKMVHFSRDIEGTYLFFEKIIRLCITLTKMIVKARTKDRLKRNEHYYYPLQKNPNY